MNAIFVILVLLIFGWIFAYGVAVPEMRRFAAALYLAAFFVLLVMLSYVNDRFPFSGGGDDSDYYRIAHYAANWSDAFSAELFSRYMAQPGFVMILNAFNLAFQPDLLGFKILNLTFFLLLVQVWTRIVVEIEGVKVARKFAFWCALLTPMWFYVFFLLKDMLIAFLLACFVLGAVWSYKNPRSLNGWALQLIAILAVIPLRAPLVGQALVVIAIAVAARGIGRGPLIHKAILFASGLVAVSIALALVTNPETLEAFGVASETRVFGSVEMMEHADRMAQESSVSRALFPVIYIFTELAAFNADSWRALDAAWLRGILAGPWIFLGVPTFLLGVVGMLKRSSSQNAAISPTSRLLSTRVLATPWVVVVAFIAASALTSWLVGDTTRWRIADMPALLAVAVSATCVFSRRQIFVVTALWCLCVASLFSLRALLGGP